MERERWLQVSKIFEAALAAHPEERDALVASHCGTDEELRREVEQLIASHQKAVDQDFIGSPAAERAAPMLASDQIAEGPVQRLKPGQEIAHYEIKQLLGVGGMGEVYLASDRRLDRLVALKILPQEVATDQRRMLRFKQEAKAVSALNQPNILTIYEFGEFENLHYLASEFIDGETLRRQLVAGQGKLSQTLEIAIQICAALDAAHEAKIVHRDIKPENVMIRRRDSVVKVLDFGLAKLSDRTSTVGHTTDTEAATEVLLKTRPGSVMGTFNYMSPEQVQGQPVDHRSDIWSVGVLIYEMVAGQTPFAGPTHNHTAVSILEKEPESLQNAAKLKVPAELERIVGKTLEKDRNERYQSVGDLLVDLRKLKKQIELDEQVRRSDPTASRTKEQYDQPKLEKEKSAQRTKAYIPYAVIAAVLILGITVALLVRRSLETAPPRTTPATPVVQRQLNYWITVQKYRDGAPFEGPFDLAKEINFEKDYRIRLNVSSPEAGYLYVLNESPEEGAPLSILFPSPKTNSGSAFLAENTVTKIPETSWFALDDERGREKVWLVWSLNTVPELEALRRFANPTDKGVVSDTALNRDALRFIQANADPGETVERNERQTQVRADKPLIVHLVMLEHN
jgi:serine/threonine protein kinase